MEIVIYFIFAIVITITILTFKDWLLVSRKLKRMRKKHIEKLYRVKDMGEMFINVLSILYVPLVLDMLTAEQVKPIVSIVGTIMVAVLVIWLNCRIYMYNVKIRELENEKELYND